MDMEYDSTDGRLQTVDISDLSFQLQRLLCPLLSSAVGGRDFMSIHGICHSYPQNECKFCEMVPTFHAHDYMLATAVNSLMVLIFRDSYFWSYNRRRPKRGITLSIFFHYLQWNPKWPEFTEFSNEQLHQMGYVFSVACCPNMNARRQLI